MIGAVCRQGFQRKTDPSPYGGDSDCRYRDEKWESPEQGLCSCLFSSEEKEFTGKAPVPCKWHERTGFRLAEASGEVTDECDARELGAILPLAPLCRVFVEWKGTQLISKMLSGRHGMHPVRDNPTASQTGQHPQLPRQRFCSGEEYCVCPSAASQSQQAPSPKQSDSALPRRRQGLLSFCVP